VKPEELPFTRHEWVGVTEQVSEDRHGGHLGFGAQQLTDLVHSGRWK
jgi:hypothetical protein